MRDLWEQHPLPWTADDSRPGHEGDVKVFDAAGRSMVWLGDMEDCTYADILLSQLWAAAPDLLDACEALMRARPEAENFMVWLDEREQQILAAIAKARGEAQ